MSETTLKSSEVSIEKEMQKSMNKHNIAATILFIQYLAPVLAMRIFMKVVLV